MFGQYSDKQRYGEKKMKKIGRKTKSLKAGIAVAIALAFVISSATAIGFEKRDELNVEICGPSSGVMGEYIIYESVITGGVPPYSPMWCWGDGSRGSGSYHVWLDNDDMVYNIALVVEDSEGNIAFDDLRVSMTLPTDSTVFIDKFVKLPDSSKWSKQISARVGDILNTKIVVKTLGSETLALSIGDEFSEELNYVDGSASIEPDIQYPPEEGWGGYLEWQLDGVSPESVIEITYDTLVVSEFSGDAYLEGMALNGVGVFAELDSEDRGPSSGGIAQDTDAIQVQIIEESGSILYVDDDGGAEFTSIQDAIDTASNGDTVYVFAGTYVEHVLVDKSIKLIGQNSRKTIIDGSVDLIGASSAVRIMADKVTVSGFTIRNAMKSGIYMDSTDSKITQNIIVNNGFEGIYLHSGDNNIITDNEIIKNARGVLVLSGYNLIKGNAIKSCDQFGISIDPDATPNHVYQNNFIGNAINALDYNVRWGNHYTGYSFSQRRFVGNYWDDYIGVDEDGDGFGDSPYTSTSIYSTGLVLDLYPFMKKL